MRDLTKEQSTANIERYFELNNKVRGKLSETIVKNRLNLTL